MLKQFDNHLQILNDSGLDRDNKISKVVFHTLKLQVYCETCTEKVEEPTNIDCVWFKPRNIMLLIITPTSII